MVSGDRSLGAGPERPCSLQDAYTYCTRLAMRHYENFPVGSLFIPRSMRKHVHAIYSFARIADDFADEARFEGSRLENLHAWRESLAQSFQGKACHPVFIALGDTATKYEIPQSLLGDLLTAFEQDVVKSRYENFDEVLAYCQNSANPVGRLVLLLFGYRDEALHRLSDRICTGLQLANFWQDVAIDLKKDRIYLPRDEQARFGVDEAMLQAGTLTDPLRRLLAFQVERTREIFEEGRALPNQVRGMLSLELKLVWLGGTRILEKLRAADYDFYRRRPKIGALDKIRLLVRALGGWNRP